MTSTPHGTARRPAPQWGIFESGKKFSESDALAILQDWLVTEESRCVSFGIYIRLWLQRWGLKATDLTGDKDTLFNRLLLEGLISSDPSQVSSVLGTEPRRAHLFWKKPERLEVTLAFCRISASFVLIDHLGYAVTAFDHTPSAPGSPETLALLDSFWEHRKTFRPLLRREQIRQFGTFIRQSYLREYRQPRQLAQKLAGTMGWQKGSTEHPSYGSSLSQALAGITCCWNLRTLPVLAKFAGMTVEKLVTDYNKWLAKQPDATK